MMTCCDYLSDANSNMETRWESSWESVRVQWVVNQSIIMSVKELVSESAEDGVGTSKGSWPGGRKGFAVELSSSLELVSALLLLVLLSAPSIACMASNSAWVAV